jgi:type IV secretion system protein VirB1
MLAELENLNCQNMAVQMEVMQHVVHVESSYNPFAIGVVGGRLVRQPKNLPEALATVKMLETRGYNFSLGLAQVNRYNLTKYGLNSYENAFEACPNLKAGSAILAECYHRLNGDWGKSFSCYYSGNSITGFRHGYVQKIYASMRKSYIPTQPEAAAIAVVGQPSRRVVDVTHHPVYAAAAPDGSTSSAPRTSVAPAAEESRATATLQRSQQPSSQPLSKMQRIIASYRQPNPSSFPTAALTAPAAAAGNGNGNGNGNTAPSAQELQNVGVAQVETTPLREPPVLLQPTNAAPEAVGTAKKSAFVF